MSDIKQKIEDFKLLAKTDRRIWAVAGFFGIALILTVATGSGSGGEYRPRKSGIQAEFGELRVSEHEAYNDLVKAFRSDIEAGDKEREEMKSLLQRLGNDQKDFQQQVSTTIEIVADQLDSIAARINTVESTTRRQSDRVSNVDTNPESLEPDGLEPQWFDTTDIPPPPPPPDKPTRISIISPGDAVEVQLITGVNAPVDGTPYPVVFKIDGPITGPDGSSLNIGEARLLAAAQGSEADGRALFRLTKLAIRHNDGRRSVADVDGWIVGEDGVRGMKGRLIDKLGRLIAATAGVSFGAAIGERIDERNQFPNAGEGGISITGDDIDFAGASALTDASNRIGQIFLDRYEKIVPVIEILSGRKVVAIFSQSTEIALIEDFDNEGIYSTSLD